MDSKFGFVYLIFSKPSHMALIGGTRRDVETRLNEHAIDLRKGTERNKSLLEDYKKYGEGAFDFEMIIRSSDYELCEKLLIELFSRVDMAYNRRDRNGEITRKIEKGETKVSQILYQEIETFLQRWKEQLPYYYELLIELEDMKTGFMSKAEKLYQREFKIAYLTSKYSIDAQRVVKALFKKTEKFERELDKDLYDFNIAELRVVLKSLNAKTVRSLQDKISTIKQYIDFAIEHGKSEYRVNFATAFDTRKKIEDLLDKEAEENMIFDKDEIMEMAMSSDNAQDGVILGLLFDGVSHKNEFEELIELTKNDIVFNEETIQYEAKLSNRSVPLSSETYTLVQKALDENVYVSITGDTSRKYKIAEGVNVLRGLRGRVKVKAQIINQRLIRIKEIFDYEYLNATAIIYSGQIHHAIEMMEDKQITVDGVIVPVLERFGVPVNDSSKHYLKTRIEDYLNKDND